MLCGFLFLWVFCFFVFVGVSSFLYLFGCKVCCCCLGFVVVVLLLLPFTEESCSVFGVGFGIVFCVVVFLLFFVGLVVVVFFLGGCYFGCDNAVVVFV